MYYFASDTHLGLNHKTSSIEREREVVRWLDMVSADALGIFLAGDIFDFWFEYRRVVPKGFTRLLGKIAEITDRGTEVHFFAGNHDLWLYEYLHEECGMIIHHTPETFTLHGKEVFVGHGDSIDRYDSFSTKITKKMLRSKILRRIFSSLVHPDMALYLGEQWSKHSRSSKSVTHKFCGENEPLVKFARDYVAHHKVDYFIFGHIHSLIDYDLGAGTREIFLGEWLENPGYAMLSPDGEMAIKRVEKL